MEYDPYMEPPGYHPPQNVAELVQRYTSGERYFAGVDLPGGSDLRNANLAGANFERSFLSVIDFREANLHHVNFRESNIKCSDFRGADLHGAIFREALVEATDFTNANLTDVSFAGAFYYGIMLKDGDIP